MKAPYPSLFRQLDEYFDGLFQFLTPEKAVVDASLRPLEKEHGSISAAQGRLLFLLTRLRVCTNILEIGSLGGYSTTCLAKGLPPFGRVVALEVNSKHVAIARANLETFGLADRVIFIPGDALDALRILKARDAKFDMLFIDAQKEQYWEYLNLSRCLLRDGALVVADNLVREGRILDVESTDSKVLGARRFAAAVASADWLQGSVVTHVGAKGIDGMYIGLVETGH